MASQHGLTAPPLPRPPGPPAWLPWVIVGFGTALRLYHYLLDPPVWHDEVALILNVINRPFAELLGPLTYAEAAPPLFLFLERCCALAWGDGTLALRLPPLLASVAALPLMVYVARRCLAPAAVPWAVLLLTCSDRLLWHTCEAKPYALDALAGLLLPALVLATRSWRPLPRLLLLAAVAPLVVLTCYPGCFLCGGLLVALLIELRPVLARRDVLFGYGLLTAAVFVSFFWLVTGPARAQRCPAMDHCWVEAFPPWDQPRRLPFWLLRALIGPLDYALRPAGSTLLLCAVAGVGWCWRRRQFVPLALFGLPGLLAFLAACVRAYPFSESRVLAYWIPGLALFVAAGVPPTLAWLRTLVSGGCQAHGFAWAWERPAMPTQSRGPGTRRWQTAGAHGFLGLAHVLLLLPVGLVACHAVVPWDRADFPSAVVYVLEKHRPGEVITGNAWEDEYYFRHLRRAFRTRDEFEALGTCRRHWLIVSGSKSRADRLRTARVEFPGPWRTLGETNFDEITVLLRVWEGD